MPDISRIVGNLVRAATTRPNWQRYGMAILLPVAAAIFTAQIISIQRAPLFVLFTLAVVLSSVFGGMKPGFLTVGLSFAINWVSVTPAASLEVGSVDDVIRLITFLIVGSLIALFVGTAGELEQKILLERNRLHVTLHSIGDAVIVTDLNGRVTTMNRVAEEATGWSFAEASGQTLESVFNIINDGTRRSVENPVKKVLEMGRVVGLANHTILIRKDGSEIPIDDSAAPILTPEGIVGVVLVFRDITEAKLSQAALLHAEKLATVGKLASTIAHEINNPLESVSNLLYLISADHGLSPDSARYVEVAQSEVARAAEMTRQTLSFHRGQKIRATVSLADLVKSVLVLYGGRAAQRGVQVVTDIPSTLMVSGFPTQLRQVVSNLVTNAIDAMPSGGILTLMGDEVGGEVRLRVSDTATGIDEVNLKRIFEPFFTTKSDVGTGLGLWVSKRIIEEHDGRISVESPSGNGGTGTAFTVMLPSQAGRGEAAASC